jgi:hypothetical protein
LRKIEPAAQKIQGKSFRSGIPTLLKKSESEDLERNLKILGRWKSSAYRCYIQNSDPGDRIVFLQTAEALQKIFFCAGKKTGKRVRIIESSDESDDDSSD